MLQLAGGRVAHLLCSLIQTVWSTVSSSCSLHRRSPAEKQYLRNRLFHLLFVITLFFKLLKWFPCSPVSPRVAALGGVEREEVAALGGWWPPRPTCTLVTLRRPPANSLSFLPSSSSLEMMQPRNGLLPPPHLP